MIRQVRIEESADVVVMAGKGLFRAVYLSGETRAS